MTKIIHPYQLLEAPQVNILNNNIVEDVNYSYENSDLTYSKLYSTTITTALQPATFFPEWVLSNSEYNPDIYDISEGQFPNYSFSFKFDIDTNALHYEMNTSNINIKNIKIKYGYTYWKNFDTGDVTETNIEVFDSLTQNGSSITIGGKYKRTAQSSTETVWTETIANISFSIINENKITFTVSLPNPRVQVSGFDGQTVVDFIMLNMSFDIFANILDTANVQVDTNSNLTLESNELMQQDTKVNDTTQISEYIADNIKTHYADGKATISMQVVDDGTQEYDLHDIVIPYLSTKLKTRYPVVTEITDATVSDYDDSEVSLYGASYFLTKINNLWVLCSNVLLTNPSTTRTAMLTSLDLINWEVITLINENSSSISEGFVVNGVLFFQYYTTNVNVLYFSKGLDNINDLQTISFEKSFSVSNIAYYNGYYYIAGDDIVNGEYSLVYRISDTELEDGVNAEKIFEVSSFRSAQIQFYKNKAYIAGSDYSVTGHPSMIYATADFTNYTTEVFANSPSGSMAIVQFISSNDAIIWGRYYSLDGENWIDGSFGDVRYQKISTNKYINGYIGSVGDDTKYSLSPTQEWNDLIEDVIGVTYNYEEGIILVTSGTDPVIYIINFYGTNNPLLTNSDGTPKEFEITSSELVYDGLTYYNIEAVEST